jgi:hypothetical protein
VTEVVDFYIQRGAVIGVFNCKKGIYPGENSYDRIVDAVAKIFVYAF